MTSTVVDKSNRSKAFVFKKTLQITHDLTAVEETFKHNNRTAAAKITVEKQLPTKLTVEKQLPTNNNTKTNSPSKAIV